MGVQKLREEKRYYLQQLQMKEEHVQSLEEKVEGLLNILDRKDHELTMLNQSLKLERSDNEFKTFAQMLYLDENEVEVLWRTIDADNSGQITIVELFEWFISRLEAAKNKKKKSDSTEFSRSHSTYSMENVTENSKLQNDNAELKYIDDEDADDSSDDEYGLSGIPQSAAEQTAAINNQRRKNSVIHWRKGSVIGDDEQTAAINNQRRKNSVIHCRKGSVIGGDEKWNTLIIKDLREELKEKLNELNKVKSERDKLMELEQQNLNDYRKEFESLLNKKEQENKRVKSELANYSTQNFNDFGQIICSLFKDDKIDSILNEDWNEYLLKNEDENVEEFYDFASKEIEKLLRMSMEIKSCKRLKKIITDLCEHANVESLAEDWYK